MDKHLFDWPELDVILSTPCIDHGRKRDIYTERHNGVMVLGHRLAFCKKHGIEPDDIKHYMVHRACCNLRCIEPAHLILCPPGQGNPFFVKTGKAEGKQLWRERVKANPQDFLYPEFRNYRIKDYVK
jgi:hypothetical protein